MDFLKEIEGSPGLLPAEHKAAAQLLRLLERSPDRAVDLKALFVPPHVSTIKNPCIMSRFTHLYLKNLI